MGVKSGLTEAFAIDATIRNRLIGRNKKAAEIIKPFINGRDVRRYFLDVPNLFLIYTFHDVPIERYPQVEKHLLPFKKRLEQRATKQAWYELQQPQLRFAPYMDGPKIVFPDIATSPRFVLDENGRYGSNTVYFIPGRDLFLLGLLNSQLGGFYFKHTCAGLEGKNEIYLRFFGQYLEGFPVRKLDQLVKKDKGALESMVKLVEQILALHADLAKAKTGHAQTVLQRQIDATDRQIDQLVFELYDLTDAEIALVEGSPK
jgi:hypothetical protein